MLAERFIYTLFSESIKISIKEVRLYNFNTEKPFTKIKNDIFQLTKIDVTPNDVYLGTSTYQIQVWIVLLTEAATRCVLWKNLFLKMKACNFIKNRLQHRYFSFEYCESLKNTYFEEHLRAAASIMSDFHTHYRKIFSPILQKACATIFIANQIISCKRFHLLRR